jgi:hypothetical protein
VRGSVNGKETFRYQAKPRSASRSISCGKSQRVQQHRHHPQQSSLILPTIPPGEDRTLRLRLLVWNAYIRPVTYRGDTYRTRLSGGLSHSLTSISDSNKYKPPPLLWLKRRELLHNTVQLRASAPLAIGVTPRTCVGQVTYAPKDNIFGTPGVGTPKLLSVKTVRSCDGILESTLHRGFRICKLRAQRISHEHRSYKKGE